MSRFYALCFALLLCGVSVSASGFCGQLTQSAGQVSLSNGANSVTVGGGTWSTSNLGGFTDGQFQNDGGYIVPVGGTYHFDAAIQIQVSSASAPDVGVDLRIVKCSGGCNALCTGGSNLAATLIQSANFYLGDGFTAAFPPTYTLQATFTGSFNTGDLIALCVDSSATSGSVKLVCPTNEVACVFSGFGV